MEGFPICLLIGTRGTLSTPSLEQSYNKAKRRYSRGTDKQLSPGHHLVSAAEASALVCLLTNPVWLVKTRLQLQTPRYPNRQYSGFFDALRTIQKEEGLLAFYKGVGPGLLLVSHGAIQFTAYEELRKIFVRIKSPSGEKNQLDGDEVLVSLKSFENVSPDQVSIFDAQICWEGYSITLTAKTQYRW